MFPYIMKGSLLAQVNCLGLNVAKHYLIFPKWVFFNFRAQNYMTYIKEWREYKIFLIIFWLSWECEST
jgi:hypothetical protein